MFDELRATPEVLYGAVIAFVIVVLLTPAVGGMARMLGAVDRPDARRINRRPIPRLGGLAIFLGILVPALAFLDLSGESRGVLLGAAVATVVGAVDDFRGLSPSVKLPGDIADRDVILLDPMLATGNSTAAAIETVKRAGATSVRLIALIAAPEGIERVHREHADVRIVVASVDRGLNEKGYILPGLGDAGDRLYGTK